MKPSQPPSDSSISPLQEDCIAAEVMKQIDHGVMVTDREGRILQVNPAFTRITGYEEAEVVGKPPSLLRSGQHGPEFYSAMFAALKGIGKWSGEIWNRHKSGQHYLQQLDIRRLPDGLPGGACFVALMSDITAEHIEAERVRHSALHDPLTGLANRILLKDRVQHEIARAQRIGKRIGIAFIDLDRFKPINDLYGHEAGDQALREIAGRLSVLLRSNDTIARVGGDEFVALLPDIEDRSGAQALGHKLLEAFRIPFRIDGVDHEVGASIGISLYPDDGETYDMLIGHADMAMYRVKEAGGNEASCYDPRLNTAADPSWAKEARLRSAMEHGDFSIQFQPQYDLATHRLYGAEALLRWRDPEHGLVAAADFIPLAEKTGLIIKLGNWVLGQACTALARLHAAGFPDFRIAINVSYLQILRGDSFVADLRDALAQSGIAPRTLELEITEAVFIRDPQQASRILNELAECGVSIVLDDFGTGYFSPGYLRHLPIRTIKIDRECISDADEDPYHDSIVQSTLLLAVSLGMDVVAEGVENCRQEKFLIKVGCHRAQGNLLGRPMPFDQLQMLLKTSYSPQRATGRQHRPA